MGELEALYIRSLVQVGAIQFEYGTTSDRDRRVSTFFYPFAHSLALLFPAIVDCQTARWSAEFTISAKEIERTRLRNGEMYHIGNDNSKRPIYGKSSVSVDSIGCEGSAESTDSTGSLESSAPPLELELADSGEGSSSTGAVTLDDEAVGSDGIDLVDCDCDVGEDARELAADTVRDDGRDVWRDDGRDDGRDDANVDDDGIGLDTVDGGDEEGEPSAAERELIDASRARRARSTLEV